MCCHGNRKNYYISNKLFLIAAHSCQFLNLSLTEKMFNFIILHGQKQFNLSLKQLSFIKF